MLDRLKIVPADSIVLFESPCTKLVEKIAAEISREGKLRNPLLVNPLDSNYLLLDSANVYRALTALEIDHIPVQLADPANLSVHPWQRLLVEYSKDDLLSFCRRFPRKMQVTEVDSGDLGPNHLEMRFKSDEPIRIRLRAESVLVRADFCTMLYSEISRGHRMFRAKIDHHRQSPFTEYPEASAILFPPLFSLEDLAFVARHGELLPHGFIRSDQPRRVLGIDFSLAVLEEKVPIEEKESFLHEMLKLRLSMDRIAYYHSAVFMYNG